MRTKRFRTRRLWLNTGAWATMALFLAILAIVLSLVTDRAAFLYMALGVIGAGFIVAVVRDRIVRCVYVLAADRLILRKAADECVVPLDKVRDASLLGLVAARTYFFQRIGEPGEGAWQGVDRTRLAADYLRFSPVDIELSNLALGLGIRLMDRIGAARHDMVLLRLTDGTDHLLGPLHAEDMVTAIEKARSAKERR